MRERHGRKTAAWSAPEAAEPADEVRWMGLDLHRDGRIRVSRSWTKKASLGHVNEKVILLEKVCSKYWFAHFSQ